MICTARPTKRRTASEINAIREAMDSVAHAQHPMTVLQISYQLVSTGEIEKSESEYKQTIRSVCPGGARACPAAAPETRMRRSPEATAPSFEMRPVGSSAGVRFLALFLILQEYRECLQLLIREVLKRGH